MGLIPTCALTPEFSHRRKRVFSSHIVLAWTDSSKNATTGAAQAVGGNEWKEVPSKTHHTRHKRRIHVVRLIELFQIESSDGLGLKR